MLHFENLTKYPDRKVEEALGLIPMFLDFEDARSATEQFNENYAHGGGWNPMEKWKFDPHTLMIRYPSDTPLKPIARGKLRTETVYVYPHAWVAVVKSDGTAEISRMD